MNGETASTSRKLPRWLLRATSVLLSLILIVAGYGIRMEAPATGLGDWLYWGGMALLGFVLVVWERTRFGGRR